MKYKHIHTLHFYAAENRFRESLLFCFAMRCGWPLCSPPDVSSISAAVLLAHLLLTLLRYYFINKYCCVENFWAIFLFRLYANNVSWLIECFLVFFPSLLSMRSTQLIEKECECQYSTNRDTRNANTQRFCHPNIDCTHKCRDAQIRSSFSLLRTMFFIHTFCVCVCVFRVNWMQHLWALVGSVLHG